MKHYKFERERERNGPAGRPFLFPASSHDAGQVTNPRLKPFLEGFVDILGKIDVTQGERGA